ncbi:MAG: hypothetical protein J5829_07415 [Lachnospiraceae bacterium]|nr:hypothetical protein [Lachnospiraceae bacterium]
MKTVEELYNEISASEELQKAVSKISDQTAFIDFLKEHGCEATVEEFADFVRSQGEGEIGDDAAAETAGGLPIGMRGVKIWPIPGSDPGPSPSPSREPIVRF